MFVAIFPIAVTLVAQIGDSARYGSTMVQAFGLALLLMSPYAVRQFRRWRARRAELLPTTDEADEPVPDPDGIEALVAAIDAVGRGSSDGANVVIPDQPTYQHRAVHARVARLVLDDAAHRSGVTLTWSDDRSAAVSRTGTVAPADSDG